jgi:hypothetical protein
VFAHAPDGTPHALTEIDCAAAAGRGWRRRVVPLSSACPHLTRAILDAARAEPPPPGAPNTRLRPAPWLELRTSERFDAGGRRLLERRFGGISVDAADVALLERLASGGDAAPDERERLDRLLAGGQVIAT